MIAITHTPSPAIINCELTYLDREPIDFSRALLQHAAYGRALEECGAVVHTIDVNLSMPDCVFIEDTAIVFDEVAVLASMGAESRRKEPEGVAAELRKYREVVPVRLPALIDGGDVVVVGRQIFVGLSSRTDAAGVAAIRAILSPYGYEVTGVPVTGCLHLKSACTPLPDGRLLMNPEWVDADDLPGVTAVHIDPAEPFAADVALVGVNVVVSSAFPRTNELLSGQGFRVKEVDLSEFAKAEGGVTCLSLIFRG